MKSETAIYTAPPAEIRVLRILIALLLIGAMIYALRHLFILPIIEANKLEFGMILGWLVSKAGTVVDWLFGGSESGGRRADQAAHQAASLAVPRADVPQAVTVVNAPDEPVPTTDTPDAAVVAQQFKEENQ